MTADKNLSHLASTRFSLSKAESRLLEQVETGEVADYLAEEDFLNDPLKADNWDDSRKLRASVLVWLCTDPAAQRFITHRGIRVHGAKIMGSLDLQFTILNFPLICHQCAFVETVQLAYARLKLLDLRGSHIVPGDVVSTSKDSSKTALLASHSYTELSVLLGEGFRALGATSLNGAIIGGDLICNGGKFEHVEHGKFSLNAQNIEVKGDVTFNESFVSTGGVLLNGAVIGGNLRCNGGIFEHLKKGLAPNGAAFIRVIGDITKGNTLSAEGIQIAGSAFLSEGFKSMGGTSLRGTNIGGNLECNGGIFEPSKAGIALNADSINVTGSVFLAKGLKSLGEVSFQGATVSQNFICDGSYFESSKIKEYALRAEVIEVKGTVSLSKNFSASGTVSLLGAVIGGNLQCHDGKFRYSPNGNGKIALNLAGMEVKGYVQLTQGFEATGMVLLQGTIINRDFDCNDCTLKYIESRQWALFATNINVQGNIRLGRGFKATGGVFLYGATIGGNLECSDGEVKNSRTETYALIAESMQVHGSVWLRNFIVNDGASFSNTRINNGLHLVGKIFSKKSKLDLEFASVRTLADSEESWPEKGQLLLEGFVYEKLDFASPNDQHSRLRWLNLQNQDPKQGGRFSPQPYEQLARVLKDSGNESDAMGVLIGKQEDMRRYGGLGCWGRCWNWFLGKTIAHGYKPTRALFISLAVIIFGTGLFHIGYRDGWIEASDLEAYTIATAEDSSLTYPEFLPLTYSLDVFLPVIDLHQASYWIPKASLGEPIDKNIDFLSTGIRDGGVLLAYFWLQIILGWVLTSLWVAGFTGLVRRLE